MGSNPIQVANFSLLSIAFLLGKTNAFVAQLVEQRTENPRVVGSIPTEGTICGFSSSGRAPPCQGGGSEFEPRNPLQHLSSRNQDGKYAGLAHLVERHLAKVEVASSSLVTRSKDRPGGLVFFRIMDFVETCGFSSSGRAPPSQGGCGEFESRNPLQKASAKRLVLLFFVSGFNGIM